MRNMPHLLGSNPHHHVPSAASSCGQGRRR